ncbi:MAG TPA: hypothetical protein VH762_10785 [Gemmatimonadaceae bacterium]|jgi:hypothetical protein
MFLETTRILSHRLTPHVRLRCILAFVMISACGGDAAPREVIVRALDYAYQSADSLPAGRVAFGLENVGKVPHELIVVGLRPEATLQEIVRRDRADSTWRHLREPPSGILTADPGVRTPGQLLVNLEAGRRYLLLCNFQDSDSTPPHLHLGMARIITAY